MNGDMAMLLRSTGIMSEMVISHDLRIITKNPKAKLNDVQRKLLGNLGNWIKTYFHHNVFSLFQLARIG